MNFKKSLVPSCFALLALSVWLSAEEPVKQAQRDEFQKAFTSGNYKVAYEGFRKMNRATREMPEDVARTTAQARATYLDAIRDWARHGARSRHAFGAERARAHVPPVTEGVAQAQACFRLGQFLIRHGRAAEGQGFMKDASRLHPESWCIWRQGAGVNDMGFAAQPDFWERVDGLGAKRYYAPVDMEGMP